jgi:AcrR family transcriptional regulator
MTYDSKKRKIKADLTKQKIYDSAAELYALKAYEEVSVDSIVKLAGVAKGSFYKHFSSKAELVAALIQDQVVKADTDYKSFLDFFPDDASAKDMLLALIGKISEALIADIGCEKMKAVYRAQITRDIDTGAVTSYNREIYKMFGYILERGIRQGEFKTNLTAEVLTRHLMLAIRGITYEWCIRYPDFDYKAEALEHFRLLISGLSN